jgi:hypothetical protein
LIDSFPKNFRSGLPDTRNAKPLSLSLNPQDTPTSKFKAVAAALIRNKNRIKTPGKPPDISAAFKTAAALEDDNEENNKQQNTNTRFLSATIALCIFSCYKKDCLKSKSYNDNGTSVKTGGNFFADEEKKKTEGQTSINNLTLHLYVRFCSQIVNRNDNHLKIARDISLCLFLTKQIISIHEEPKLTAKYLLERELPDLPVLR